MVVNHSKLISEVLCDNEYPGRGILLGKTEDGTKAVIAYFIMGRSENSRNRVFITHEQGIRTQAFDASKLVDPSLIIYAPVRMVGQTTVVTNGDQTDTICNALENGQTFEDALRSRTFEPDPPHLTPRISGLLHQNGDYQLSILKSAGGDASGARRFFYDYTNTVAGQGHLIHTYACNEDPLPSFIGEPKQVTIGNDISLFTNEVWDNLNCQNRVSLFVRFIDLKTGEMDTRIINSNE